MEKPKRIQVRIGNLTHQLIATENEAYIRSVAKEADDRIAFVRHQNPTLHEGNAIVLALVNALDEYRAAIFAREDAFSERDRFLLENEEIKAELARARDQLWELKKDYLYYRNLAHTYEERLSEESRQELEKVTQNLPPFGKHNLRQRKPQFGTIDERQCVLEEAMEVENSD